MKMELVLSPGRIGGENKTGTPFENEEVREWSHVDRLTGMLEHARIETGRWQTRHQGTAQAYGKVIDSRERNSADGNVVQKARRQVEVFQSQGIGGRSVQVVRASQWSSSRITDSTTSSPISISTNDAAVQPIRNGNEDDCDSLAKLSQVSRLCRQINGGESIFNGRINGERSSFNSLQERTLNSHMLNKSSVIDDRFKKFDDARNGKIGNNLMTNNLKSTSNEDLTQPIDSNVKSSCQTIFTRDCKARRSLQIQKSVISETEYNGRSRNKNDDLESTRELLDNKKLKSYVLGMEEKEESINDRSDTLNSPKTIIDKKFIFNGSGVVAEENENTEYLRPTPILIKPKVLTNKSNTTVVHLNNKLFLDRQKGDENKERDAILNPDNTMINNLTTPIHSRVQSLANRFTNGHNLPIIDSIPSQRFSNNDNPLTQTEIMINNSISSSRIEGLINRSSAALVSSDGSLELLNDKKLSDDQTAIMNNNKPIKRVGFCKTEIHFAAESGKVNIVETDCKPPPSNRFRRRRRNSVGLNAPIIGQNKNLPLIHFGDTTYEKYIFGQPSSSSSSFKEDRFNALNLKDEIEPSNQTASIFKEIESQEIHENKTDQRLSSASLIALDPEDKLMVKNGLRGPRIKTNSLKLEPKPPIIVNDAETEEVSLNFNKNFHQLDETIVDHSFKGSHTTTVNLGANVTSKLQKHTNNEGKCDTVISTGIQLKFKTKLLQNSSSHQSDQRDTFKKSSTPSSLSSSSSINLIPVSKIPRPLIQSQQSILKSTHLIMNLNKIKNFNTTVTNDNEKIQSMSMNNLPKNDDRSLNLKHQLLLSSFNDNNYSGLIIDKNNYNNNNNNDNNNNSNNNDNMKNNKSNSDYDLVNNNNRKKIQPTLITINLNNNGTTNCDNIKRNKLIDVIKISTPRFTPVKLNNVNDNLLNKLDQEFNRVEDAKDNQQQHYSSGSEQADEEVRSYMLGSKIHRSKNEKIMKFETKMNMKCSIKNVNKSDEDKRNIDDDVDDDDLIDIIDDELDIVNSDLPTSDEICFESIKRVEKNMSQDDIIGEFNNVVTSDNENNKVLMNIVKTHEPVLARVEEMTPQNNIRTRLSSMKKNITNETNRSKKSSSSINTINTVLKPEAKDDNCDIKTVKEIVESKAFNIKDAEDNPHTVADPTYVNVFENAKKSVPIYENYRVNRKGDTLNDKMKYSTKSIKSTTELKSVKDSISKTTNGICDNEKILSNTDCTEADLKLATISDMNNLIIRNNNRDNQKVKSSKIRSKKTVKTVRPPSSTSSIESVNQNSLNDRDAVKDCEARPTHTKSTRSSRLRRVTNNREIQSSKDTTERYSSNDRKNQITSERINAAIKNDQSLKNSNDATRSKKPIEIVYETAVFNMKNEKLSKSSKTKESRTPRYINDLICGIRPKRNSTDVKHVKGTGTGGGVGGGAMTQRSIRKSVSPANRHWK